MKYPQSFIEEIRARIRLSELIGRAIPLRRAGREFHALCPFHKEKSPSFTVNDEKGFFHCFGCGAHGDAIGFTMDYEHLGYRESVERLAGMAGLSVPRETVAEVERARKSQSLQEVMEHVAAWFEQQLDTGEGELARRYLAERGLSAETAARFRLGYAPGDRDALLRAMKPFGITQAQLVETGMLIQLEDRTPYSRFRRRLMFPIRDRKSKVIAFGGRVLPGEPNAEAPKYLNSPETPLFHKGRQLFNLDLARRPALDGRSLIICEGYMDVIALAQAGIHAAVAPLGTAVTPEQLQLCWQLVDEPTMCLDGDKAGQRAMARAMELALPLLVPGKTLRIAALPAGADPDSLIKEYGRSAFDEIIAAAQPLAVMLWQQDMGERANTPEARAAQEERLMQKVGTIKHPTVQHYYRNYVRERLREQPPRKPWGGAGKKWNNNAAQQTGAVVSLPPLSRTADVGVIIPAGNLLALAIACPALLREAAAEEFWLHAPMPASWQQQLHHLITEQHISQEVLTSEALWESLGEEADGEALASVITAMGKLGIELSHDEFVRYARAQRLWGEVVNDVSRAQVKAECSAAEAALAQEMNEENLERLTSLKAQLDAIDRERSRYWREDPLTSD